MEKLRIGLKLVLPKKMTRIEYNNYRGWDLPEDEKHLADDQGFLVEYVDGGNSNHPDHDGYISWSPKDVFDSSYKASGKMSFGMATEMAKRGYKVAREGWNGSGMFAYIVPADSYPAKTKAITGTFKDDLVPYRAYWALKTSQNDVSTWAPSGSDSLSDDWYVL